MTPSERTSDAAPLPAVSDSWSRLRRFTSARIALGRAGGSLPTSAVLDFRLAHARARDAVQAGFNSEPIIAALRAAGIQTELLATAASDRATHLRRPDLGRLLAPASQAQLAALAPSLKAPDLVIIVSDGLATAAAERHAAVTIIPLATELRADGWKLGPVCIVPFARVKVQDEIGTLLGARFTLMLLGERPGLSAPDSLGAYFTSNPSPLCTDADRNCVSNIRPEGLPPAEAAAKLAWLLRESARSGLRGIALKDTFQPDGSSRLPA